MDISDDYSLAAGIKELQALKRLYALLDMAAEEVLHPDLGLVDVPDISEARALADEFSPGTAVSHGTFGLGRVVTVGVRDGMAKAQVDFPRVGVKTIYLEFADLEKVSG